MRSVADWLTKSLVASVLVTVLCEVAVPMHVTRGNRDLSSMGDFMNISVTEDGAKFTAYDASDSSHITVRCALRLRCCARGAVEVCGGRPFYQPARHSSASGGFFS